MKKQIITFCLFLFSLALQAQALSTEQAVYLASNRDSLIPIYIKFIFDVRNSKKESVESFAKKELGKNYDKYFSKIDDMNDRKNIGRLQEIMVSNPFKKLFKQVIQEFTNDEKFAKSLKRTSLASYAMLNEMVCTKADLTQHVLSVLKKERLYFTFIMCPFIFNKENNF